MKRGMGMGVVAAALLGVLLGYALRPSSKPKAPVPPPPHSLATHGETMARRYCGNCHLFPEANLLTRQQWLHYILPSMAVWLGVEPANYESMPEGRLLETARIFPTQAQISQDDWFAVWDYYRHAAPSDAPTFPERTRPPVQHFKARRLSFHQGTPTICLTRIDPAQRRLYVGDSYAKLLAVVDHSGRVLERIPVPSGPVALAHGRTGWFAALIGRIFPSDLPEGSVVALGEEMRLGKTVLSSLRRPTDVQVAELTGDNLEDFVVCQFGNYLGALTLFENKGEGQFNERVLAQRAGALRTVLADFDGDGLTDILALMAQAREGLNLFLNRGGGNFEAKIVLERHPLFGYADLQVADVNRDGLLDLLTANGDNGDHPTPHKDYHGIRLLLNRGKGIFEEVFFYPMQGAYQARAADYDQDGDWDIAGISFYPDFESSHLEAFVYLENTGDLKFAPRSIPEEREGRWMTMDAGDLDGDGDVDIVLGAFAIGPTTVRVPEEVRARWRESQAAVLVLENVKR